MNGLVVFSWRLVVPMGIVQTTLQGFYMGNVLPSQAVTRY